jgi:hypothetical protein
MTAGRPKGASTGRLLLDQLVDRSQDEKSLGMIMLMASCTASTNLVSPGGAWAVSGARPAKKLATAVPAAGP